MSSPVQAQSGAMVQVNPVSQLRDVAPEDWAYQALLNLSARYNCLVGYPDGSFRGRRSLSRDEFAAGLNACLNQLERLLSATAGEFASAEDLETVRRLIEEFGGELAVMRGRIDGLTARIRELEVAQFSTTTQLRGDVTLAVSDVFGGDSITNILGAPASLDSAPVFQYRTRLDFNTSFYGPDNLRLRLQASNAAPLLSSGGDTGGEEPARLLFANDGRLAIDNSNVGQSDNSLFLEQLSYQFAVSDRLQAHVFAAGGSHFDYANTFNPYLDDADGGRGALSRFGQRNPLYGLGGEAAGLGLNWRLGERVQVDLGYLADRANAADTGLFNGNYAALAQVGVGAGDRWGFGLSYLHAYSRTNQFRFGGGGVATGSFQANLIPLALTSGAGSNDPRLSTPVSSNSYGMQGFFELNPNITVAAWAGWTQARLIGFGDAEIWNYALTLAFPDLGREGNLGAIIVGMEPTLRGIESGGVPFPVPDRDAVWHLEASYRYQFSDRVALTPGLVWLPALNQNAANDDVLLLTIQADFQF
ncbi:MAG: carbohydrate porin [Spirulinaceae cyanobacterium SM2_1_0]|nr:carbohydrate porin [Spirulinaceae cyanobacterium SM2_1_0]